MFKSFLLHFAGGAISFLGWTLTLITAVAWLISIMPATVQAKIFEPWASNSRFFPLLVGMGISPILFFLFAFGLIFIGSYLRYVSRHTVRVRD